MSKKTYKLTLKVFDEQDNCLYIQVPAGASWFLCSSVGTIDERDLERMFYQVRKAGVPKGSRPVFKLDPNAGE